MKHLITGVCCLLAVVISASAWAADARNGAMVFNRCIICHSNSKGAPAKIGPNLFGVVGRKAGTAPGFNYSAAMKGSGIVWTNDKLKVYLAHPGQVVQGTRMTFAGIGNPRDVDDVVAYLDTLK
jgi:cytochrome c